MKKTAYLLVFVMFFAAALTAQAHAPSGMSVSFDHKISTVHALIAHNVNNPTLHYIYKVNVFLNGKKIEELSYSRQDNSVSQTVDYVVPDVKSGDVITLDAYCNKGGELYKQIVVRGK